LPQLGYLPGLLNALRPFARFKKKENVEEVKRFLNAHPDLARFEKAQLGICAIFSILVIVYLGTYTIT
jgi:hypothetical protein